MPTLRLLTSVAGDGPVHGTAGDEIVVDAATARIWADGERAELVRSKSQTPERGRRPERQATLTRPERR